MSMAYPTPELESVPHTSTFPIVSSIITNLFSPEMKRIDREITELNRLNNIRRVTSGLEPADGFMFEGDYFRPLNLPKGKSQKVALHEEYHPRIRAVVKDKKIVADDLGWMKQMLFLLLDPCENLQNIRDALPDCLSDTLNQLRGYNRIQPEAYTILDNPRSMKQYAKMLPKLELYSVGKLFY